MEKKNKKNKRTTREDGVVWVIEILISECISLEVFFSQSTCPVSQTTVEQRPEATAPGRPSRGRAQPPVISTACSACSEAHAVRRS